MTYPAHLEFFDLDELATCNWEFEDGSCVKAIEVMVVFQDTEWADVYEGSHDDDILSYGFCRPHAELALIDLRSER